MEIKTMVDLDTLTEEEKELLEKGEKTEDDFLADYRAEQEKSKKDFDEKLKKAEELANNYKIRAEKAEAKSKESKSESTPKNDNELSQTDLIALIKADVAEEDISEVLSFAKLKNISASEALKSTIVKTILAEKSEERKTANATNTSNSRKGASRKDSTTILDEARRSGTIPESDEELNKLIQARFAKK